MDPNDGRRLGYQPAPDLPFSPWLAALTSILFFLFLYHAAAGEPFWLMQFLANIGVIVVLGWAAWLIWSIVAHFRKSR